MRAIFNNLTMVILQRRSRFGCPLLSRDRQFPLALAEADRKEFLFLLLEISINIACVNV